MIPKLQDEAREKALQEHPQWCYDPEREAILRDFVFKDFEIAFNFMTQVAQAADEQDHHPEWFNVYNKVNVLLTTHDCQGLSARDFKLAKVMDTVFDSLS